MNDALIIQQVFPGFHYEQMIELTRERNKEYCNRHAFDYECLIGVSDPKYSDADQGAWPKVDMIRKALFKGYRYVVWLDADALIADMDTDLRDGCIDGIGACWMRVPQPGGMYNHWNVGVLFVQNSHKVREFLSDWLAEYPGEYQWKEQGVFNKLAMKSKVVQTISDRWNSTIVYSEVPDAVILGFHGDGDANQRYRHMQETLEKLSTKEKAEEGLGLAEAPKG